MANTIIGFRSLGGLVTLGNGDWSDAYPQANLLTDDLFAVARTTDALATSSVITGLFASAQDIGVIGLFGFNATVDATVRLRLYSDAAFATQIYDSAALPAFPGGAIDDPQWIWWGGGDQGNVNTNYSARAFRIDISDTGNPAGFIDIGRIEIAKAIELPFNFNTGAALGRRLRSTSSEMPGGSKIFRRRSSARTFVAAFDLDDDALMATILPIWAENDLDALFVLITSPDDPNNWGKSAMLCRFVEAAPAVTYTEIIGRTQATLKVEQAL